MKKVVLKVEIGLVDINSIAMKSYQEKNLDGLKLTMKYAGQLESTKAVIRKGRYEIFDGISRFIIGKELGWKFIDVEVLDFTDEQIKDQFVLRNFHTKRSLKELCNQAEIILNVLGMSQGKKRKMIGDIVAGNDDFGLIGKDRFELACTIIGCDLSATTLRRTLAVKEFERTGDTEVKGLGLMEKLEKGFMKPNTAFTLMNNYKELKKEQAADLFIEAMKYEKGLHFDLYNKTCEDLSDIKGKLVQLVFSSHPYFSQRVYPFGTLPQGVIPHGEEPTVDEYIKKQVEVFRAVRVILEDTGSLFLNTADTYDKGISQMVTIKLITEMVKDGWFFVDEWIWKKTNQKPQPVTQRLQPSYEKILHFVKDPTKYYFKEFKNWIKDEKFSVIKGSNDGDQGGKKETGWSLKKPHERFRNFLDDQKVQKIFETSVFNWNELNDIDPKFRHVAPFPTFLPLLPILMCTKPGDTVLDIYSGTGTTAAVALQLGRHAIGYDTDTVSHNFAMKRLREVEKNLPTQKDISDFENDYMSAA